MTARCAVCDSEWRTDLEEGLTAGEEVALLADVFEVKAAALWDHLARCLPADCLEERVPFDAGERREIQRRWEARSDAWEAFGDGPPTPDFDPARVRLTGLRPAEWSEEAACFGQATREEDPWHPGPDGHGGPFSARAREACRACPVRLQCLAYGLALLPLGDVHGIYGGFTPPELRHIAQARGLSDRKVAQHGTRSRRVAGCTCRECRHAHAVWAADQRAKVRYAGGAA